MFDNVTRTVFEKRIFSIIFFVILLLMTAAVFYNLNHHTVLTADDYQMSFVDGHRINSLADIYSYLYDQYFHWGGRTLVHFFTLLFLWIGKPIFDIVNTIAYILLVLLIYFHAVGRAEIYPMLLVIINFVFFSYLQVFGQIFLWLDGACNYLFGIVIALSFLLIYRLQIERSDILLKSKIFYPAIFLYGFIAAWTNENIAVTIVCITLYCTYENWKMNHTLNSWQSFGVAGSIFGSAVLLLAPGNFNRIQTEGGGLEINILNNFVDITKLFFNSEYLLYPIGIMLFLAMFAVSEKTDRRVWLMYFIGLMISMYAMLAAPYYADRAKLGSLAFCTILLCYFYTRLNFSNLKIRRAIILAAVALLITIKADYRAAIHDIKDYEVRELQRIEHIENERRVGNFDVVIESNHASTKYCSAYKLKDLQPDPEYIINAHYAKYYGVKTVKVNEGGY